MLLVFFSLARGRGAWYDCGRQKFLATEGGHETVTTARNLSISGKIYRAREVAVKELESHGVNVEPYQTGEMPRMPGDRFSGCRCQGRRCIRALDALSRM